MGELTRNTSFIPVTITDGDGSIYERFAGQSFACLPASSSSTMTFNFASGNQYKSFHRIGLTADALSAATTNVTSYTIYQNGALITPLAFPLTLTQGDTIYIEIVATNTALAASVELTMDGIASPVSFSSAAYYFPLTTVWLENMVQAANHFVESDQSYQGTGTNTAQPSSGGVPGTDYLTDLIFDTPLAGSFEMIVQQDKPINSFCCFGIGNRTSYADNWFDRRTRMNYSWQLSQGDCRVVEAGTIRAVIGIDNPDQMLFRIKGTVAAGVGTITYHYSNDNGSTWTLAFTSVVTYAPATNWYQEQVHRYTDATRKNYGIFTPCKMVQL